MKDNEENDSGESEAFVCSVMNYRVFADKRQYTVLHPSSGSKRKDGTAVPGALLGYFKDMSTVLTEIRESGMRSVTPGAQTLDEAITRLSKFNTEFTKAISGLKALERG